MKKEGNFYKIKQYPALRIENKVRKWKKNDKEMVYTKKFIKIIHNSSFPLIKNLKTRPKNKKEKVSRQN